MNSQELRALQEAYNQVYQLDEISDRKVNSMVAQRRRQFNRADEGGSAREIHLARNLVKAEKSAERRSQRLNKEQVDLYDIILSHLLDEGYADTEQAAEAIMVNMSEEWRQSIVEVKMDPRGRPASGPMNVYANPKGKPDQAHLDAVKAYDEKQKKKTPEQRKAELDAYRERQMNNK